MPITLNGTTGITTPAIDASAGNSALTTLSVGGNNISAVNSLGFRNRIINGGMAIIQRGTQTGVGGTSAYAVDRWLLARESGSMAARFTISSEALTSSDLPLTQDGLTNCQKLDVTTASGGISAGFSNYLAQRIEGFNIADVGYGTASAKPLTLSFWLKTDTKTGVMSVSLYTGAARNYIQTINATTSWQKFTLTFPGDTGGSILAADNAQQMQVMFVLSAGSDFYATANQWNAGFDNAASTQADFTDSTANNIYITGVQLEAGSVATPFERRDYGRELAMCQRYFQKSYPQSSVPGASYDSSYGGPAYAIGTGNFGLGCGRPFAVVMRAAPTMVTYDSTGTSGRIIPWNLASVTYGSINATDQGITGLDLNANSTLGRTYTFGFTASAEL